MLDFDVPEGYVVAVILQKDVAAGNGSKAGILAEFSVGYAFQKQVGLAIDIENLDAVQPMLDVVSPHENARAMPNVHLCVGFEICGDDVVDGGGLQACGKMHAVVDVVGVVNDLIFVTGLRTGGFGLAFFNEILRKTKR